jgi:F-type H+-transporting ATPase subunit delta
VADDYRTTEVGERYAQALFDLADETGALEAVRADLASLRAAWNAVWRNRRSLPPRTSRRV